MDLVPSQPIDSSVPTVIEDGGEWWKLHHPRTMRISSEKVPRLSITLNKPEYEALLQLADKNDVSLAWLVRKAVERMLESDPQLNLFHTAAVQEVMRR